MRRNTLITTSLLGTASVLTIISCGGNEVSTGLGESPTPIVQRQCGTETPDTQTLFSIEAALAQAPRTRAAVAPVIDVYVHVVTATDGTGQVSDDAISRQIAVLNDAYAGKDPGPNKSFGGANTGVTFRLVGVDRTVNDIWFKAGQGSAGEQQMKSRLRKGTAETLNIYTTNAGGQYLGWSSFPWKYSANPLYDGVVCVYSSLPGGSYKPYDLGDTATHEVGHWLGLYHTFQGGCTTTNDYVTDTAAQSSPTYGCPNKRDSCTGKFKGLDPTENFMDYTEDACMWRFTSGQSSRIANNWSQYRLAK